MKLKKTFLILFCLHLCCTLATADTCPVTENKAVLPAPGMLRDYFLKNALSYLEMHKKAFETLKSADDIRGLDHAVISFSAGFRAQEAPLRAFLAPRWSYAAFASAIRRPLAYARRPPP